MNDSSPPNRPQPKLVTKGKVVLMVSALVVGASLGIVREYRSHGAVSTATIGASVAAFIIGLIILIVISRYANKPEK
jgi:hypothetical protein